MAIMQMNIFSKELQRTVNVSAIIPGDTSDLKLTKYKSLYLLHGILGSELDWLTGTRIRRYAEEKNIAIFMPAGENSGYLNFEARRANYTRFIGKELVTITRQMFNLSDRREDTYIAGLSMGGYGALLIGLTYHQTFSQIGSFSSGRMNYKERVIKEGVDVPFFFTKSFHDELFGNADLDKVDILKLVSRLVLTQKELPYIYMACGNDDFALEDNRLLNDHLHNLEVDHIYIEDKGGHDWDFWDKYIKEYLNFLTLDTNNTYNSGNVIVNK